MMFKRLLWALRLGLPSSADSRPRVVAHARITKAVALNAGRCRIDGGKASIVTDPTSGGYSAFIPVVIRRTLRGPAVLHCDIDLREGSVGLCAVRPDHSFIAERVAARVGAQQLELVVPRIEELGGLLVRNALVNGRRSRVDLVSVAAATIARDSLLLLRRERPSRRLKLPLRECRQDAAGSVDHDRVTTYASIDSASLAVIVVDVWEELNSPVYRQVTDKIADMLQRLRALGILIVHAPHDQPIHPAARPLEGETVLAGEVFDTDFIATTLREAGVTHLLYMGYHSNMCLLTRSIGQLEMRKQGFHTVLVRDLSLAKETEESVDGGWFHKAAVHFVEINGGKTISAAELASALAE